MKTSISCSYRVSSNDFDFTETDFSIIVNLNKTFIEQKKSQLIISLFGEFDKLGSRYFKSELYDTQNSIELFVRNMSIDILKLANYRKTLLMEIKHYYSLQGGNLLYLKNNNVSGSISLYLHNY